MLPVSKKSITVRLNKYNLLVEQVPHSPRPTRKIRRVFRSWMEFLWKKCEKRWLAGFFLRYWLDNVVHAGGAPGRKKSVPATVDTCMIPLSPQESWKCSTCGANKHWSEYPVVDKIVNKRGKQCSMCRKVYNIMYRNTPVGIANSMWSGMNQRAGNKRGIYKRYEDVQNKFSKASWLEWALPRIEQFMKEQPHERPSIDRIDGRGHYEPSNCRIISWTEHKRLKKAVKWQRYVEYLTTHPDKLHAFVQRHKHKIEGKGEAEQILRSLETLIGSPISFTDSAVLNVVLANPSLLLMLMYIIDNGK